MTGQSHNHIPSAWSRLYVSGRLMKRHGRILAAFCIQDFICCRGDIWINKQFVAGVKSRNHCSVNIMLFEQEYQELAHHTARSTMISDILIVAMTGKAFQVSAHHLILLHICIVKLLPCYPCQINSNTRASIHAPMASLFVLAKTLINLRQKSPFLHYCCDGMRWTCSFADSAAGAEVMT